MPTTTSIVTYYLKNTLSLRRNNFKWIKVWSNKPTTIALISLRDVIPILLYWTSTIGDDELSTITSSLLTLRLVKDDQLLYTFPHLLYRQIQYVPLCDSETQAIGVSLPNTHYFYKSFKNTFRWTSINLDWDVEPTLMETLNTCFVLHESSNTYTPDE